MVDFYQKKKCFSLNLVILGSNPKSHELAMNQKILIKIRILGKLFHINPIITTEIRYSFMSQKSLLRIWLKITKHSANVYM